MTPLYTPLKPGEVILETDVFYHGGHGELLPTRWIGFQFVSTIPIHLRPVKLEEIAPAMPVPDDFGCWIEALEWWIETAMNMMPSHYRQPEYFQQALDCGGKVRIYDSHCAGMIKDMRKLLAHLQQSTRLTSDTPEL